MMKNVNCANVKIEPTGIPLAPAGPGAPAGPCEPCRQSTTSI